MVKKETFFSYKLDYAFLLNNINEEEEREGGGGKGRRRGRWTGKKGEEKKQGRKEDFAEVHFPFRTCWGDSVSTAPLAGREPASPHWVPEPILYHLKLPETFQEHPAERVVPASQDERSWTSSSCQEEQALDGRPGRWGSFFFFFLQMRLREEMLWTPMRQGKAGIGGTSCLRMGYSPKDLRHWGAWKWELFLGTMDEEVEKGTRKRRRHPKGEISTKVSLGAWLNPAGMLWGQWRSHLRNVLIRPWGTQKSHWWKAALWEHTFQALYLRDVPVGFGRWQKDAATALFGGWKRIENLCTRMVKAEAVRPPPLLVYWVEW